MPGPFRCRAFIFLLAVIMATDASVQFSLTEETDSVSLTDSQGELVARLLWGEGEVDSSGDSLTLDYLEVDSALLPNPKLDYPLQYVVKLTSDGPIQFPPEKGVQLKIWQTGHRYSAGHVTAIRREVFTINNGVMDSGNNALIYDGDYARILPVDSVSDLRYLVIARNVLAGEFSVSDGLDMAVGDLIVPYGDTAILLEGTRVSADINVYGVLGARGSEENRLTLENVFFGNTGETLNRASGLVKYAKLRSVSTNSADAWVENCNLSSAGASNGGVTHVNKSSLRRFGVSDARISIDSSRIDSSYHINNSIVNIFNSEVHDSLSSKNLERSYVHFKRTVIHSYKADELFRLDEAFLVFDESKLVNQFGDIDYEPINVWNRSTILLKQSAFIGFDGVVDMGYNSSGLVYNNTFVNSGCAIRHYGMVDTIVIVNNIFYNSMGACLDPSSRQPGSFNRARLLNNLSSSSLYKIDTSTTILEAEGGNFRGDPLFYNLNEYTLSQSSPAIDRGLDAFEGLPRSFSVLDTTFTIDSIITISGYVGASPDVGKHEYGSDLISHEKGVQKKQIESMIGVYPGRVVIQYESSRATSIPTALELRSLSGAIVHIWNLKDTDFQVINAGTGEYQVPNGLMILVLKSGRSVAEVKKVLFNFP